MRFQPQNGPVLSWKLACFEHEKTSNFLLEKFSGLYLLVLHIPNQWKTTTTKLRVIHILKSLGNPIGRLKDQLIINKLWKLERTNTSSDKVCYWEVKPHVETNCNTLRPVVRSLVSANRWLRGIKTYRFPWFLTLVSANHASSNPGLMNIQATVHGESVSTEVWKSSRITW